MITPPSTAELLQMALGEAPEPSLSDTDARTLAMMRSVVETVRGDALDGPPSHVLHAATDLLSTLQKAPSWFDRAAATLLAPLFDDRPRLAAGLRGHDLRQCTYSSGDLRLDLEVESPVDQKAPANDSHIRGQLDAEAPLVASIPVAVFLADTNRLVTSTMTAADGRFDLVLPAGVFDFAFRLDDVNQLIGRLAIP